MLFLALLYVVGSFIASGAAFIVDAAFGFGSHSAAATIVSLAGNLVLGAFAGPVTLLYMYKLFVFLKATQGTDVSSTGFKKWLVAFLVIGCVCIVAPITVFLVKGAPSAPNPAYSSDPFGMATTSSVLNATSTQ